MKAIAIVVSAIALATTVLPASGRCGSCLKARYWSVAPDDWQQSGPPTFPETAIVANRGDLAIAFSGGGTRSASASVGQLRGLMRNGWLNPYVRYISAVSGGGWAAVPFTFSKIADPDLLGRPIDPAQIDRQTVATTPNGAMVKAIAASSLAAGSVQEAAGILSQQFNSKHVEDLVSHVLSFAHHARREPGRLSKTYARMLGGIFIDPLVEPGGTSASSRLFTWNADSVAETMAENPGAFPGDFVVAGSDRPYLVVSGTMISARRDYGYPLLMPVEYTPLYSGVRQQFGGRFGGSYVWSWAYDTLEVGDATDTFVQVRHDADRTFSLADVAASTGAAPQLFMMLGEGVPDQVKGIIQQSAGYFPFFTHFSVRGGQTPLLTQELAHGDGGFGDNLGVLPLLARQVHNVLAFVNTNTQYFEANDDLQALFFAVGPPGGSGDKTHNQVFDRSHYTELMKGLEAQRAAGKPLVYCGRNWTVNGNAHFNVRKYDGLNICFFYNAPAPAWQAALPDAVRALVTGRDTTKDGKNFDGFPWFSTFEQNKPHVIQLTTAQVNLLSSLTEWIVSNDDTVRTVRDALSVTLPAPAAR
ncbi:MAG TPA: hypothetical protein VH583_19050 [Vicinamibacterales bacterium]